jgi:hypothetical protein
MTLQLAGSAPSGTAYRLRDATITVRGPDSTKVWNTEDAPDQMSLSATVTVGDYTALLADGWRLERIDGAAATPVTAMLVSDNPVQFTVAAGQRTAVPLEFRVDDDEVDLTGSYDITVTVDEPHPPVIVVANAAGAITGSTHAPSITVYPARGDGDVAPLRTIAGPSTTLTTAADLVVAKDRIIVCDLDAITMFPLDASGDVAPVARIAGPTTGLTAALGIAVANGEIYVVQHDTILVFPMIADGDVAPTRQITSTGIQEAFHLQVDSGSIYVLDSAPQLSQPQIKVFPATASGATAPTRVMQWSPALSGQGFGLAIRGSEVFTLSQQSIDVLPIDGGFFVQPLRSVVPVLDAFQITEFRNELYVAGWLDNTVRVYPADADSRSATPIRTIGGPSTGLDAPLAVFAR